MDNKKHSEIVFDAILRSAFYNAVEEEIAETEKKDVPQIEISKKHKRIQRRLYNQRQKRINYVKPIWMKALQGVATCIMAFCVFCSVLVFSVPKIRADFFEVIIKPFEKYISFENKQSVDLSRDEYSFEYIPENFLLTEQENDFWHRYKFIDSSGELYFEIKYYPGTLGSIHQDNESVTITELVIGDNIVYYVVDDSINYSRMIWNDKENIVVLTGNISKETMINVAKGIIRN